MAEFMHEQKRMKWTEFLHQQELVAVELKKQLDEEYVRRAETLLLAPELEYGQEKARKFAVDVVLQKKRLRANNDDDEGTTKVYTKVNDVGNERDKLFDVALLCINAVVDRKDTPIEQDRIDRCREFHNFTKILSEVTDKNIRSYKEQCEVNSYGMMKQKVTEFIKKYGPQAGWVQIVFNGHGTKKGELKFHEGEQPHMSVFEKDSEDIVKKFRSPENGNPQLVQIIFAQCYAHVRDEPPNTEINVVWLTNEKKLVTTSLRGPKDADHEDLNDYAKDNPWVNIKVLLEITKKKKDTN